MESILPIIRYKSTEFWVRRENYSGELAHNLKQANVAAPATAPNSQPSEYGPKWLPTMEPNMRLASNPVIQIPAVRIRRLAGAISGD